MLIGDDRLTAEAVARKLGLDEVRAKVLPDPKAEVIRTLQAHGRKVAMAGDGVNDAPAHAHSDAGIATGTGTDVAMESAGVTLVKGDLRRSSTCRRRGSALHLYRKRDLPATPVLCLPILRSGAALAGFF